MQRQYFAFHAAYLVSVGIWVLVFVFGTWVVGEVHADEARSTTSPSPTLVEASDSEWPDDPMMLQVILLLAATAGFIAHRRGMV